MRHKYHSTKVKLENGMSFDSKKECARFLELSMLQKAGKIRDLKTQVPFELIPMQRDPETGKCVERACNYIADFTYWEQKEIAKNGNTTEWRFVVEDTKGVRTVDYVIKRKLMLWVHKIRIREV